MGKVISFFSLKGGVGKTTSCANIAVALGKANVKILLIDFDANGNLSSNFVGIKKQDGIKKMIEGADISKFINKNISNNVDLITSSVDSSFMIINDWKLEYEKNFMDSMKLLKNMYDIIFIDLSASWNLLNKIVLTNSDSILWPIICTPYAIESINQTLNAIRSIQLDSNPKLKIEGVFVNIYDKRTSASLNLYAELSKTFGKDLYDTMIPKDSLISKLQNEHETIVGKASWAPSATSYCELAKEILKKVMR